MDFAFLPPEINSARMYSGPGSGSLLAAAGSWDALAVELSTTAEGYESVLSGLISWQWRGPASEAMSVAAAHYMGWLQTTAEQAKQTAMQARAAAAAYEQTHAMTVPPPAITANRTQLASLIATNVVGQNTAAIAATEAQYAEYWAQDAAAMSGYDISSATARQLCPFSSPTQTTSKSAQAAQSASVAQANTTATANPVLQALSSAIQSLQAQATQPSSSAGQPLRFLDIIQAINTSFNAPYNVEQFASGVIGAENNLGVLHKIAAAPATTAPAFTAAPQFGGGAGLGNVTATFARGGTIGPMSVPASWSAPSSGRVAALQPAGFTTLPGTDEAVGSGYPGYPGMPAAGVSRGSGVGVPPRYGIRLTVMSRPPAAG